MNGQDNISSSGHIPRSALPEVGARVPRGRRLVDGWSWGPRSLRELGRNALRRGTLGRPLATAALLAGIVVVGAIAASRTGVLDPVATKIALGISIAVFFGLSLAAIGRHEVNRPRPVERNEIEDDDDLTGSDDGSDEAELVYRWRKSRLTSLGVPDTAAELLSIDRRFSVGELERLLASGCPVDTALRIVWPIS